MSLMLEMLWQCLRTYLAAVHCIASILSMACWVWGSNTVEVYPKMGLTKDLLAVCLMEVDPIFKLLCKKPNVLLALEQMLLM